MIFVHLCTPGTGAASTGAGEVDGTLELEALLDTATAVAAAGTAAGAASLGTDPAF